MSPLIPSSLLRNIVAVISGTAIAQLITLAFAPLITRIYGPELFGVQGVFLSLVSVLSPVVALRYPLAIVIAENDKEARILGRLSVLIASGLAGALGMVLWSLGPEMRAWLGFEALGQLIWFLPVALVAVALQDVASYKAARRGAFRLLSFTTAANALLSNSARCIGGLVTPIAGILVAVTTFAPAVVAASIGYGLRRRVTSPAEPEPTDEYRKPLMKAVHFMRKHGDFPVFRVPNDLLHAVTQALPVLVLGALFSPSAAGFYALSRSVLNMPSNVIGDAIGNVLYARLAELHRHKQELLPLVVRVSLLQFLGPGVVVGISAFFFPDLFAFVFGEEWRKAGEFAQWMSPWCIGLLVAVPLVRALPVIGKQKVHLLFNIVIFLCGGIALLAGAKIGDDALSAVACFSCTITAIYLVQIGTYLTLVRKHDERFS